MVVIILDVMRIQQKAIMMYKIVHGHALGYLQEMFIYDSLLQKYMGFGTQT